MHANEYKAATADMQGTRGLAGIRLLLADEATADRRALQVQLAGFGLRVDTADDARAALAALAGAAASDPYRIAILRRNLSGVDSGLLAVALGGDPAYRDLALVLLDEVAAGPCTAEIGFCARLDYRTSEQAWRATLRGLPGMARAEPDFAGHRVLVVDDNPVNQQIAARLLEKLGCRADVANDGLEAVALHHAAPYDLILMDCQMPELDGYQATQRIRALEGTACRTPVIALTAHAASGEQDKCAAAGMDGFLAKPLRPAALKDALQRWLQMGTGSCAATHPVATTDDELDTVRETFGADFIGLARLYQADSPPRIAALREAGWAGDGAQVAKIAHVFAGSCASIGAAGLAALCRELEMRAKAGVPTDFAAAMAAIEAEYRRIDGRLHAMMAPD